MKTEHREHPLGTPGLTARLRGESERPERTPSLVRKVTRALARVKSWAGLP